MRGGEDDELVARAKRGDADAWRALHRDHAGRLLVWLASRPTGDSAVSVDDVASEAWLTAAEKVHDFHGSASEFGGWLFGIARKLSANTRRRGQRRGTHPSDLDTIEPTPVPGPEPAYAGQDWVVRALATLPARERDVVGCIDVVGLDVAATALALGISPTAVRVARHRGLKRLGRAALPLREAGEEGGPGQAPAGDTAARRSR
jgi:RNA polymerase sigma-70 factor (ECF subfamily)